MKRMFIAAAALCFSSLSAAELHIQSDGNDLLVMTDAGTPVEVHDMDGNLVTQGEVNKYGYLRLRMKESQQITVTAGEDSKHLRYRLWQDTHGRNSKK